MYRYAYSTGAHAGHPNDGDTEGEGQRAPEKSGVGDGAEEVRAQGSTWQSMKTF